MYCRRKMQVLNLSLNEKKSFFIDCNRNLINDFQDKHQTNNRTLTIQCHSNENDSNQNFVPNLSNIINNDIKSYSLKSLQLIRRRRIKEKINSKLNSNQLSMKVVDENNKFLIKSQKHSNDDKIRRRKSHLLLENYNQFRLSQIIISISFILITLFSQNVFLLVNSKSATNNQQENLQSSASTSTDGLSGDSSSQSTTTNSATCFGGLQTFEKISMSSFENPTPTSSSSTSNGSGSGSSSSSTSGSSFGSGILVQQDDQALTSECVNLCRSQSNCLSFVIDYNKFECKSYATTQQELQQEFDLKYQSLRSVNQTITGNDNSTTDSGAAGGYQASSINFQHLLPSASSNYFEKICLDGVANRNQFSDVCGQNRLWTIERVVDSFLDGYVEKEVTNVNNKDECSKLCIFETQFVCRSADYDQSSRLCRLSKEDRRTQPQAMRYLPNSNRQYIENQCATPGPSSCVYETKKNLGIISMDALKFAQTIQDCQMKCNQEITFNCRSYSFNQQRCFLSGDDSFSLNSNLIKLPIKQGWQFGEKKCLVELCTKGLFSYEKITGYTLRSALSTPIDLMMTGSSQQQSLLSSPNYFSLDGPLNMMTMMGSSLDELDKMQLESSQEKLRHLSSDYGNNNSIRLTNTSDIVSAMMMYAANNDNLNGNQIKNSINGDLIESASYRNNQHLHKRSSGGGGGGGGGSSSNLAITNHCRHSCNLGYLNCPAFTIDYKNNRCQRLDRNSQGRHNELVAREGFSYYEKICLRVPEIMTMCQDKYWIFERVIGYELAPRFYDKSLKFVQSRRDCEEYCLEEKQFQCRSALYNDETSDCKLSRYDRRLVNQEGGYNRNFNNKISYLENQCIRDHHNIGNNNNNEKQSQLQCYYEQAKDEPSYPTFTEHIEMVPPTSPALEKESSSMINSNNKTASHRYGSSYCEQLCNDNSKFECHSFGYYSSTAQCFLSGDDSISAGESATTLSTGFTYFEKKCKLGNATIPNQPDYNNNNNTEPNNNNSNDLNPYFIPPIMANNNTEINNINSNNKNSNNFKPINSYESSKPTATDVTNDTFINPNQYKCGVGHSFVYQRISGFEPIGGYLTLLIKNNDSPGIVSECADLCKRAFECRAFVVDYNNNQCYAMLENSSIGMLSLRQTLGKDYFEGFCVADYILLTSNSNSNSIINHYNNGLSNYLNCKNKTWIMDKIVDQAVIGVQAQKVLMDLDRIQCRQACLEERLFYCKSAMFDSSNGDCKLYSIDRESMPQMRLLFTKGVDFFENQCQIVTNSCPYDAIERDLTIVSVTKSLQAKSTFDCEFACNIETTFNCRSYTYLEQYPSLPNLCLLSSDSRSTSQKGSIKERSRALYAERNCFYRRPRYPLNTIQSTQLDNNVHELLNNPYKQTNTLLNNRSPHYHSGHSTLDSYAPPTAPSILPPSMPPIFSGQRQSTTTATTTANVEPSTPSGGMNDVNLIPIGQNLCEPHQYTFERTFGYDYRLGQKERAPIAPTIGIAIGCQQECLRRSDRCQSFVVEYGLPYQSCFLIDTQVGANKKLLVKSPNSAYFEKVCLPRLGVDSNLNVQLQSEALMSNNPDNIGSSSSSSSSPSYSNQASNLNNNPTIIDLQSMDISPSYSSEPWSPQLHPSTTSSSSSSSTTTLTGSQMPYYLQQQQLIKNYPSRTCAKLWSFERFINHNFTIQSEKFYDNILTRAHCETLCLNEASFNCRSATYDYILKVCRLFKNTRRTIMSQFVDLDSPANNSNQQTTQTSSSTTSTTSIQGSAQVLGNSGEVESINSASSNQIQNNIELQQMASSINRRQNLARQLTPGELSLSSNNNIDYLENTCTPEPSSCQYRQLYDLLNPYIDKINHAVSLSDCQRQCDSERLFTCKSINYEPSLRNCMLINEDLISLNRGQQHNAALIPKKNIIYSEKGNCEMISVQCNSQEMLVSINFDSPFKGRIMAKGNPEQCYLIGDGQNNLQFPIVFGPKCNSRQEGHNTFVNEIIIQQHPVIMTDSDKTIRVMCAFEAPEQTITLKNPTSRDNKTVGIDVNTPLETGRTRNDKQHYQYFNSVVSNKASPPSVLLRIVDLNGRDASMINLGDDLILKIQMQQQQLDGQQQNSALGIFARNLAARSSNGESLLLIDNDGCPVDQQVFPALEIDPKDGKSLYSNFKAFRFPSSGLVNFEVQIRFCPERCQPVDCSLKSTNLGQQQQHQNNNKIRSFGKRRRKRQIEQQQQDYNKNPSFQRTSILESVNIEDESIKKQMLLNQREQLKINPLDSLSTVMKPGKGFDYVRELVLGSSNVNESSNNVDISSTNEDSSTIIAQVTTTPPPQILSIETNQGDNIEPEVDSNLQMTSSPALPTAITATTTTILNENPPVTEINQDFEPTNTRVEDQSDSNNNLSPLKTTTSKTGNQLQQATNSLMVDSLQTPPILMHIDEKVLLNQYVNNYLKTRGPNNYQSLNNNNAPYGRFPLVTNNIENQFNQRRQVPNIFLQTTTSKPTQLYNENEQNFDSNNIDNENNNNKSDEPNLPQEDSNSVDGKQNQQTQVNDLNNKMDNNNPSTSTTTTSQETETSTKDLPLKFSILVGESQSSSTSSSSSAPLQPTTTIAGEGNWIPSTNINQQQPLSVMNTSKLDSNLDHIVIPGKDGQFVEEAASSSSIDNQFRQHNNNAIDQTTTSNLNLPKGSSNSLFEQTFDALPSNSVPAQVKINNNGNNNNHQHFIQSSSSSQAHSSSESAASHRDRCNNNDTLWNGIIWTGTFVIILNVSLVILSLFLYFKRVHLRNRNHNIMRASNVNEIVTGDTFKNTNSKRRIGCGGGNRWPSVLLKSKNNLGTSLNTHEHFFCKLNSKQQNCSTSSSSSLTTTTGASSNGCGGANILGNPNLNETINGIGDFNWPNLSTSSSHSTISSMASHPLPSSATSTSIVRINQARQLFKQPTFSDSSSIRAGNFNTGIYNKNDNNNNKRNHILDLNSYDETHATYTNNIDKSHTNDAFE